MSSKEMFENMFDGTQMFDSLPLLKSLLTDKFGGILEAFAATTIFPPKSIVDGLEGKAVCNAVRIAAGDDRLDMIGRHPVYKEYNGQKTKVILDENLIPNKLFLFCFKPTKKGLRSISRSSHTQLNHIYTSAGKSPDYFANLANLCVSPAFLAKLTDLPGDKEGGSEVVELLKFRAFQLYGFNPENRDFRTSDKKYGHWEQEGRWLQVPEENIVSFDLFQQRVKSCRDRYFATACECGKNINL